MVSEIVIWLKITIWVNLPSLISVRRFPRSTNSRVWSTPAHVRPLLWRNYSEQRHRRHAGPTGVVLGEIALHSAMGPCVLGLLTIWLLLVNTITTTLAWSSWARTQFVGRGRRKLSNHHVPKREIKISRDWINTFRSRVLQDDDWSKGALPYVSSNLWERSL